MHLTHAHGYIDKISKIGIKIVGVMDTSTQTQRRGGPIRKETLVSGEGSRCQRGGFAAQQAPAIDLELHADSTEQWKHVDKGRLRCYNVSYGLLEKVYIAKLSRNQKSQNIIRTPQATHDGAILES